MTTLFGAAFCFGAFLCGNVNAFLALLSIGELLIFATQVLSSHQSIFSRSSVFVEIIVCLRFSFQGPVNYVCLHCVEPSLRPLSMAMLTVAIHLFGDVPSSPLVGLLLVSLLQITHRVLYSFYLRYISSYLSRNQCFGNLKCRIGLTTGEQLR